MARHLRGLTRATIAAALMLGGTMLTAPAHADELADGFQNPPQSARPRVWWHWMNGNVTVAGIDADLEWLHRVGVGGVQNFDANLQTPQIVNERLIYMTPPWRAAFRHAVERADALGMEFAIAASPGWSETGGAWVPPADGMKKLVWSETLIPGGRRYTGRIAPAPDVTGPYQSVRLYDPLAPDDAANAAPPRAQGDIAVLAIPVAPADVALPTPAISTADGAALPAAALFDADMESSVAIARGTADAPGTMTYTYPRDVTVRSARLFVPRARPPFGDAQHTPVLEVERNGAWQRVTELPLTDVATTASFAPVTGRRFRLVMAPFSGQRRASLGQPAPGAEMVAIFGTGAGETIGIGDFQLSGEGRIDHAEVKAGFGMAHDYGALAPAQDGAGVAQSRIVDVTSMLRADGTLDWTPPAGSQWRILRMGYSLTGKTNHPATPEATGLEVDKYDPAAVRRYLETYLGMYRETVGDALMGQRGIQALLTDSIEVGPSNWTPRMLEEFRTRRGYDARMWLPALAGIIINSRADSERFLHDYRQTLAELLAQSHYATVAAVAHEQGLRVYGEALEDGRPVLGDDMAMRAHTDVPMAALWTYARSESPRPTLLGDMRGAASVAHIYGQNIVAAESMTSAFAPWAFAPSDLKRIIDLEFANGVNRPIIHTSVHQPVDDKVPGLSLMIFGQYFNRHESWANMARPWIDYIARTGYMLQQGRNVADVAVFYGEDSPLTALFDHGVPADLPRRHAYDFVNPDVLINQLSVDCGDLVARSGARYRALQLAGTSQRMTLATLRRIAALVDAGAMVIGAAPASSPALMDNPAEFSALRARLWGPNGAGQGRVIVADHVDSALAARAIRPDFSYSGGSAEAEILSVHRTMANGDIYFINNRRNRAEQVDAHFRITGARPELWNAITGTAQPLSYTVRDGETIVPLTLGAEDAVFVVFRPMPMAEQAVVPTVQRQSVLTLNAPWDVRFQAERGAPAQTRMAQLQPLDQNADAGIRYFSGTATYSTRFALPRGTRRGAPLWINLGTVGDVAEVRVNGVVAGTSWFGPHRMDISRLVRAGTNQLEVRVANLWVNRLIGDRQPGATPITFTAAPTYRADAPLRPSGLIGPVTLETIAR